MKHEEGFTINEMIAKSATAYLRAVECLATAAAFAHAAMMPTRQYYDAMGASWDDYVAAVAALLAVV